MDNDLYLHDRLPNGRPLLRDSVLDENFTFDPLGWNRGDVYLMEEILHCRLIVYKSLVLLCDKLPTSTG